MSGPADTTARPPAAPALLLTLLAMLAFAGNSLLCRVALRDTPIDAASFTSMRLCSGALTLWLLVRFTRGPGATARAGDWRSALALFVYAAGFSWAYLQLSAGLGALLLFGAVQATMIGYGLVRGERFVARQTAGLLLALAGLVGLLLPGAAAPAPGAALLMLAAGAAWGVYSLRGRSGGDPLRVTAGNFARSVPFTLLLSAVLYAQAEPAPAGLAYAVASGALASGVGYAVWYAALPTLKASTAATVQLSVPVIAALGGVAFLGETLTVRLLVAGVAILGGIALVIRAR